MPDVRRFVFETVQNKTLHKWMPRDRVVLDLSYGLNKTQNRTLAKTPKRDSPKEALDNAKQNAF